MAQASATGFADFTGACTFDLQGGNGPSENPTISSDGRYIAFDSEATNFSPDTNGVADVYLYDRSANIVTERLSVPAGTTDQANGASTNPSISRDGSTIAFESLASNLAGRLDTNGTSDIYARDRTNQTTTLVSTVSRYSPTAAALGQSYHPSISPDGTNVAWATDAHWPADTNGVRDIYYLQLRNGPQPLTPGTQRILSWDQAGGAGQSNGANDYPAASNSTHAFASQAASFGVALGVSLIIDHAFVNQGGSILCAAAAIAVGIAIVAGGHRNGHRATCSV